MLLPGSFCNDARWLISCNGGFREDGWRWWWGLRGDKVTTTLTDRSEGTEGQQGGAQGEVDVCCHPTPGTSYSRLSHVCHSFLPHFPCVSFNVRCSLLTHLTCLLASVLFSISRVWLNLSKKAESIWIRLIDTGWLNPLWVSELVALGWLNPAKDHSGSLTAAS